MYITYVNCLNINNLNLNNNGVLAKIEVLYPKKLYDGSRKCYDF